ncbi:hypothetical protein FLJU110815_12340 [Flavobacterium jumunjinense]|uniref:hypothetical protein n=1 Tax=Flavobacterium sp. TaxID=239 RepID=UPI0039F30198
MKKMEVSQMENLEGGRKFWGWSDWEPTGPCVNGFQTLVRTHFVLFITNTHDYNHVAC